MSGELDDELRADFVVESSDLLQKLGTQLVDLERRPQDHDLLNAIFRGFHTIKGGAGFFDLHSIVRLCHVAEDVFNLLRNGTLQITPEMMDVVQGAVDELRVMLEAVAFDTPVPEAEPATIEALHQFAQSASSESSNESLDESIDEAIFDEPPQAQGVTVDPAAKPGSAPKPTSGSANGVVSGPAKTAAGIPGDPFSEDEFEALLDQLHGSGTVPGAAKAEAVTPSPDAAPVSESRTVQAKPTAAAVPSGSEAHRGSASHAPSHAPSHAKKASHPLPAGANVGAKPERKEEPAAPAGGHTEIGETSVRIDTERLDQVMNLIGELVLVRNRLKLTRSGGEILRKNVSDLDQITSALQSAVMRMRMQPIRKLFAKFPRMARDTARKLEKIIEVELQGEDTELDKSLVEALNDPLVHMVRNAIDHGIEMPATRRASGKSESGRLQLSAEQAGDHILITVKDDGGGIDAERLRRKAIERGQIDSQTAATLSQEACLQLIFLPGLSTKEEVSDLSGRGVGMDAVRASVAALNGTIQIKSALGQGTSFFIRVPLTLAIQPVLMLTLGSRLFALPLQPVQDVFILDESIVRNLDHWDAMLYRGETLRLMRLTRWAGIPDAVAGNGAHVVVIRIGVERFGIVVGQVKGREEIVVKPLGKFLRGLSGIAGATITGDGRVALIIDPPGLLTAYGKG